MINKTSYHLYEISALAEIFTWGCHFMWEDTWAYIPLNILQWG